MPAWQVTGLSLALLVGHVVNGAGALVFGLVAVGVIWTLHRLHVHAPESRTTADLIASVPGAVPARAIRVVQFTAYALIGAYTATITAQWAVAGFTDPEAIPAGGLVAAVSVTVVAVAVALAVVVPTRLLAPVATVLAAIGLLTYFYVSVAVIAKSASGAPSGAPSTDIGGLAASTEWGPVAVLVALALPFAGFEIPTTANDRVASVRRPLGIAIALVAVCATTAWVAANMATAGDFRYEAVDLGYIASDMFGDSVLVWLNAATIALTVAAILVLMWGATRVIRPATDTGVVAPAVTAVVTGVLAVALSVGWADTAMLSAVASILLLVVYVAAAHANSRLDDSNTPAWAFFALMGFVLVVVVLVRGASEGWWPVGIAAGVVAAAAAFAVKSPPAPVTRPRPMSKSERLSRGNRKV